MAKKDVMTQFTAIKGVGEKKAELLYQNGYTSLEKLQTATPAELTKIKGITEKIAKDILKEVHAGKGTQKKAKQAEKTSLPKEQPSEPKEKISEPEESKQPDIESSKETIETTYIVKKKPKLKKQQQLHLKLRQEKKQHTPEFLREEWFRYKRIPKNWRRPDGITSKMRRNYKYRPSKVRVGFRGPKDTRGLHSSGFEEITIHTISELNHINPDTQAVRIGGTVGTKKRLEIAKKAKDKEIRILNMRE
ncbi:MAG: 50S ribosomal protein L32e [Candidatus Thermoplasmatota archaeon]|nr:50S ribosomal protein L32e [Candidatus Thermoplasmatota archaeon]